MTATGSPDATRAALEQADELIRRSDWDRALAALVEAHRTSPDKAIEEKLLAVRHSGYRAHTPGPADPDWPPSYVDPFGSIAGLPEIEAGELDATTLGAALQHHGALVVRGLLTSETAAELLQVAIDAFEAADAFHDGSPVEETSPCFRPFEADEGYSFGYLEQFAARAGGGVLLAESPRSLQRVIAEYRKIGLGAVIADYLGEWPALSAKKSTLRRATPESDKGWHQDGRFLGDRIHTVNVWTALTDAGVDAPGVDVFAMPFDHIVETGTEGARHPWSVSPAVAETYGLDNVVCPTFAPGDAMLFNQMTLHSSAITDDMTKDRYAIESWFFGPSTYPAEQVPLLF